MRSSIPSSAMRAASSRSASNPNVAQPPRETRRRPAELEVVAHVERELGLRRTLDRGPAHLPVPLKRVAVAGREERAVHRDRKKQRRPGDKLLAVDVPSPGAGRKGRMDARLRRRHAEHSEERAQLDLEVVRPAHSGLERPFDDVLLGRACDRDPPRPGRDFVDRDAQRLPGSRTAHLDRSGEGVAEPFELVSGHDRAIWLDAPAGVRDVDAHGVAPIDGQHRLELDREVPVQRAPLQRDLVNHRTRFPSASKASSRADAAGVPS